MNKKIYENNLIELWSTGKDYDFGYYIVNKTTESLTIKSDNLIYYDIEIKPNDWCGILVNDEAPFIINDIINDLAIYE